MDEQCTGGTMLPDTGGWCVCCILTIFDQADPATSLTVLQCRAYQDSCISDAECCEDAKFCTQGACAPVGVRTTTCCHLPRLKCSL